MKVSSANGRGSSVLSTSSGISNRDAESLFRSKPISEIRNVESATRKQIQEKKEELRQLVGNRYRDLIDSADSIVLMKSFAEEICDNISAIQNGVRSFSSPSFAATSQLRSPDPARARVYSIACRVKYLVDSPENIWGCLDESMFLEAAARYTRARHVHRILLNNDNDNNSSLGVLSNFPLLQHQWQIVESFKVQISQRSRDRLMDRGHSLDAYADALAAAAVIDELDPERVLGLFLDSRGSWISQKLSICSMSYSCFDTVSVFCDAMNIIQVSIGQVGELFLGELNDIPLFYKVIRGSPPVSQLFGGIPDPDEEVKLWKIFREKLESVMIILNRDYISRTCLNWLKKCGDHIVSKIKGNYLIDAIGSGEELALAEKLIRATMDNKEVMEASLNWLRSVIGSEIELPWTRVRELILNTDLNLWDEIFENAFVQRMKVIIQLKFESLTRDINIAEAVQAFDRASYAGANFPSYLQRESDKGGIWFIELKSRKSGPPLLAKAEEEENEFFSCLNAYLGTEVSIIRDAVDSCCCVVLEDFVSFLESPKACSRVKDLVSYLQDKCYESVSTLLLELKNELDQLYDSIGSENMKSNALPAIAVVEKSLFIGRLLFAIRNHSKHVPLILGSPRLWVTAMAATASDKMPSLLRQSSIALDSPTFNTIEKQNFAASKAQISPVNPALLGANDAASPKLEQFNLLTQELGSRAHGLWISWVSEELSVIFSRDLNQDDALSSTTTLKGWEETVIREGQSDDSETAIKISLPSMPSMYVVSFIFQACEEVHRIGGHVLNRPILQNFASTLMEKVISIYNEFISRNLVQGPQLSDKGVLQVLFDVGFASDILCGNDGITSKKSGRSSKNHLRRKPEYRPKSITMEKTFSLISNLSERLDPIDWLTYEVYLWENKKQAYLRHSVLFGFFVQLNHMHKDSIQKLPSNSESNILRCSTVPRFKYLPISVPEVSQKEKTKVSSSVPPDFVSSRGSWRPNGELDRKTAFDENTSFGVATPLLKSFMEVGSRFGESTLRLGSMLTDRQVGRFKDKSAAAMSTFGDILPVQAAGLLSSLTASRTGS